MCRGMRDLPLCSMQCQYTVTFDAKAVKTAGMKLIK
ncbi:unnamed protein product [Mycetohabitans rhizoxinica HKI 454]|uniref:Uncharacterized protein n=1 Tax=Mycetohabitans rhizoxinica (strain DSM 19002 / CIP 109453 / HKI 454) TaxID=882378 RepID=E5AR81_MYCRK|nr:unnamed protein product [Mycetohabitans rhizoxinica HKI 454]